MNAAGDRVAAQELFTDDFFIAHRKADAASRE